jgi:hypothetical protein
MSSCLSRTSRKKALRDVKLKGCHSLEGINGAEKFIFSKHGVNQRE